MTSASSRSVFHFPFPFSGHFPLSISIFWPVVRAVDTSRSHWLQQDGAIPHTAIRVRVWLGGKFGNRMVSRLSLPCGHPWPFCTLDMLSLDYWLLSVRLAELQQSLWATLEELIATSCGEDYRDSMEDQEDVLGGGARKPPQFSRVQLIHYLRKDRPGR